MSPFKRPLQIILQYLPIEYSMTGVWCDRFNDLLSHGMVFSPVDFKLFEQVCKSFMTPALTSSYDGVIQRLYHFSAVTELVI